MFLSEDGKEDYSMCNAKFKNEGLYIIYIPKNQGDDAVMKPILKKYTNICEFQNNYICSPGFMSNTSNTINMFCMDFKDSLVKKNRSAYVSQFKGMNGKNFLIGGGKNVYDEIIESFRRHSFEVIKVKEKQVNRDHRKMIFFYTFIHQENFKYNELNKDNYLLFLNNIDVNAILIGSTNQSYSSFFKKSSVHGEADILMVAADEKLGNRIVEHFYDDHGSKLVVTKDIYGKDAVTSQKYFKQILQSFLENALD